MGEYVPRIESPLTGEPEPAPTTGSMMRQDEENLKRFKGWWKVANKEQLVSFWAICVVLDHHLLGAGLLDGVRPGHLRGGRLRLHRGARARCSRTSSRRGSARSSGSSARSRWCSWRSASSTTSARLVRRRAQDAAPARQRALERVQDLRVDRVDDVPRRLRDPALGLRPAARAARALGLPERHRDVHLLDPADQAQPPGLPPAIRVRGFRLGALLLRGRCSTASSPAGT